MCRNLHRLIERSARALPIQISKTNVPIRLSKVGRPLRTKTVQYPLLRPSDWARCIFKLGGQFFLAGQTLDQIDSFSECLELFWRRHKHIQPEIHFEGSPGLAIPFCLHGDEGRGKGKKSILVLSLQPLVTSPDMSKSNLSGYIFIMALSCFVYRFTLKLSYVRINPQSSPSMTA